MSEKNIESILDEVRVFPPPAEFAASANVKSMDEYERIYAEAAADPEAFWAKQAEELHWFR
jgi:acetyl-CoA synthetase